MKSLLLKTTQAIISRRHSALFLILKHDIQTKFTLYRSKIYPDRPAELDNYPGKSFSSAWQAKQKGKIYDKKPFKFHCEKDKAYKWCACGLSKSQPFCDGSHNGPLLKSVLEPVLFIAPETKDYWFCNCKQTNHRPLCDGSHKQQTVQAAIKT